MLHRGHDNDESDLLAGRQYLPKAEMVISMSVADKDGLDIPQNFPDVIRLVGVCPEEPAHLTPCPLTGFEEDAPSVRDTD